MKRGPASADAPPPASWARELGAQRRRVVEDAAARAAKRQAAADQLIEICARAGGAWWDAFALAFAEAMAAYTEARSDGVTVVVNRQPRALSARTDDRSSAYVLITLAIGPAPEEDHVEVIRRWRGRGSTESLSFDVDDRGALAIRTGEGLLDSAAFARYCAAPWLTWLE